jgi:hypothetical protein
MQNVDDFQLDKLSSQELRDLKAQIDDAIRAVIRQRAALKTSAAVPVAAPAPKIDLERERDLWMAQRRGGKETG